MLGSWLRSLLGTALLGALSLAGLASAIYEDQAGQFDWYWRGVGAINWVGDAQTPEAFLITTTSDVLALLSVASGEVVWRRVLNDAGGLGAAAVSAGPTGSSPVAITVSRSGEVVRAFSASDGKLAWETRLEAREGCEASTVAIRKAFKDTPAVALVGSCGGLSALDVRDGSVVGSVDLDAGVDTASRVLSVGVERETDIRALVTVKAPGSPPAVRVVGWDGRSEAVTGMRGEEVGDVTGVAVHLLGAFLVATNEGSKVYLLPTSMSLQSISYDFDMRVKDLRVVSTQMVEASVDGGSILLSLSASTPSLGSASSAKAGAFSMVRDGRLWRAFVDDDRASVAEFDSSGSEIASYDLPLSTLDVSGELEDPSEASRRHAKAVRMVLNVPGGLVLITDDEHMVCLRWGAKGAPVKAWVRSEWQALLPKDVPPVFADLPAPVPPVSGAQGLLPAWLHPSEWKRMQDWVEMQVLGLRKSVQPLNPVQQMRKDELALALSTTNLPTADRNGYRMALVVASDTGVLAALHNGDGRTLWAVRLGADCRPRALFHSAPDAAAQPPRPSTVAALWSCGDEALAVGVDAHRGTVLWEWRTSGLAVKAVPAPDVGAMLAVVSVNGVALRAEVLPTAAREAFVQRHGGKAFVWVRQEQAIEGFLVSKDLTLSPAWVFRAPGDIEAIASRSREERLYSRTRATSTGGVGFKYINPNVLLVLSVVPAGSDTPRSLDAVFLDAVTGRVLFAQSHAGASGPVSAVVSEHWAVYSYWSGANARPEIASVELGDGAAPTVSLWDAFAGTLAKPEPVSSFATGPVLHMAATYFAPQTLIALGATQTRHGIASKAVLMGTDSGSLLALDHGFLDPRLPRLDPNKMTKIEYDARRKELAKKGINVGVEVISDRMAQNLSHRHQVVGMRGVASAPTLLESTSAVFAWGTDLFYTRTFPSRQFDGLSDDFAYLGVGLSLVAMVIALVWMRSSALRSQIKQKWE